MPKPGPATPTLSVATLAETVDLLGVVVARMSDKLDQHGETLAGIQKVTLESREAARTYTDPKRYADHIGQEVYDALGESLDRLEALHSGFAADRQDARGSLNDITRQEEAVLQRIRDDQAKVARWKKRIPFIALFGLVLVLGFAIALPRFLAVNGAACAVLGGDWLKANASGRLACVFYER
ncbi:hypothetical protein [Aestuariivirga sp.]|uniref:hypothetical protein n=1 Tax=Aestuariivirga sp. TaxID=2650926 RepID=UPI0035931A46